jgi:hypothetical protein
MYVKAKKILASELRFAKNLSEEDAIAWLEGVLVGQERGQERAPVKPKRPAAAPATTAKKPAANKAPAAA